MPRMCFSPYWPDVPLGIRVRDAAQRAAHELPRRPATECFSYSVNKPYGDILRMPVWPYFSYTGNSCFG